MTITTTTISRLITYVKEQDYDDDDGNHIVAFFGIVTDDDDDDDYNTTTRPRGVNIDDDEVIPFPPPLNVIALNFTNSARARIENAGGKCLSFHQLPFTFKKKFLFTFPKHHGTILIFKPNDIRSSSSNQPNMRNVKRRIQGAFMDNLNDDLLCEILIRLPAKTLAGLKVINKRWYSFISDPSFVSKHTTSLLQTAARGGHSTFISQTYERLTTVLSLNCPAPNLFTETTFTLGLPPPANYNTPTILAQLKIFATARGLLIVMFEDTTYICNPLTKKKKIIPSPYETLHSNYGIIFGGLTKEGYIIAFNLDKEESRMIEIPKSVLAVEVNTNWWDCTWLGVLEDEVILVVATSKHEIVTWVLHDYENNKWKIKRKDVIQLERIPVVYIRPLFFDGQRFLLTISTNIYNKFRCKVHLRMEHDVSTGISKPLRSEGHSSFAGSLLCVPITSTLTEV